IRIAFQSERAIQIERVIIDAQEDVADRDTASLPRLIKPAQYKGAHSAARGMSANVSSGHTRPPLNATRVFESIAVQAPGRPAQRRFLAQGPHVATRRKLVGIEELRTPKGPCNEGQ